MTVRVLFDGDIPVHYGQIHVDSSDDGWTSDLGDAFVGQRNGLCGASCQGFLFLITGLHTGSVGLRIEMCDEPPRDEPTWDDVVEATFAPETADVALSTLAGHLQWLVFEPNVTYRVRYSAVAMDTARYAESMLTNGAVIDRYLVQFWPAPPSPDTVVRQTSDTAAYWHEHAPSG